MVAPLLAERDVADMVQSAEFLWLVGALVATMLVGAVLLAWVERWRKRQLSDTPAADVKQLGSFRAMYESGELSKEEYDRIKNREALRLRDKIAPKTVAAAPTKSPPAQPSTQEPESPPPPVS